MNSEEKIKVVIHELMHIPATFGGGFRHHDHVCDRNVEQNYRAYKSFKTRNSDGGANENRKSFFRF